MEKDDPYVVREEEVEDTTVRDSDVPLSRRDDATLLPTAGSSSEGRSSPAAIGQRHLPWASEQTLAWEAAEHRQRGRQIASSATWAGVDLLTQQQNQGKATAGLMLSKAGFSPVGVVGGPPDADVPTMTPWPAGPERMAGGSAAWISPASIIQPTILSPAAAGASVSVPSLTVAASPSALEPAAASALTTQPLTSLASRDCTPARGAVTAPVGYLTSLLIASGSNSNSKLSLGQGINFRGGPAEAETPRLLGGPCRTDGYAVHHEVRKIGVWDGHEVSQATSRSEHRLFLKL